ncbi:ras guanyl-releasing protein 3-like isoform X1 [Schistocerca serialis cubense]|uniref:ras guanyl-releasing protein 3-like isoform X1 n=2 Tax=Schistocerca serialis cubense TaxID=2023355 RepID=UPI00214F54A7|nr:ras guanyl-releasing protein 3-like isoform X1 [Schistocerca serialis cubense]
MSASRRRAVFGSVVRRGKVSLVPEHTGDDFGAEEMATSADKHEIEAAAAARVLPETERPALPGLSVRAATLPALVRIFVDAFETDGSLRQEGETVAKVLLLMHRWFTTSVSLAGELTRLHASAAHEAPCRRAGCTHAHTRSLDSPSAANCTQLRLQLRVCHAIRYWILSFPMHFDLEYELADTLKEFQAVLTPTSAELIDLSQVQTYDWMRHMSIRDSHSAHLHQHGNKEHNRKVSLVFSHLEPLQIAEHITYLEHKVIRRITFTDFKKYAETGSLRETPKLERSVALFNGLTQWIQCMVLSRTTPLQRAEVMVKFIEVAKKLLELQNFNSLMAVVGSVSHSVLARLSKTMACIPTESKKSLTEMTDLLSSTNNFSNYRKLLHECCGFRIPILGIHLKDMIALHVALPDTLDGEMINFRKMAQLYLIFKDLEEVQLSTAPINVNMDLVNTLRLSLDLAYTEDEIYELSLAREPRNSSSPQCSPTQSVLFAEWASNPCPPPDAQTIEKHVNAMVEAVFKNYDNDHDGYISHEEFEAVAENFPFIASFCVLDADHDGMISKDEMKTYFIHANYHALKNGFKHEFHETTYFKPTFCSHCAGLLWGLIRQGYKCRDCGINAHKHCKDLVVMECRIKYPCLQGEVSSHAATSRRIFRRKKKSSASESESSPPSPKCSVSSSMTGDQESSQDCGSGMVCSELGGGSLPPSPKPAVMWTGPRRKISDSLLVPSHSRSSARLRTQNSCPESSCAHCYKPLDSMPNHSSQHHSSTGHHTSPVHQASVTSLKNCCHSEQLNEVNQKLAAAEEAKQRLMKENQFLLQQLEAAYKELHSLRDHVGEVRQQTVAFILSQMETLHIQKDTHL